MTAAPKHRRKTSEAPCVAVIADMVKSRTLSPRERAEAQRKFAAFVAHLNYKYSEAILAKFVVTLGDECQGLLWNPEVLPDLIWDTQFEFDVRPLRLGIGYGTLHTPLQEVAINIDGPVLHLARKALEESRQEKKLGGVFAGFGDPDQQYLNGFARILHNYRARLKPQQRLVIQKLRAGYQQNQIASQLRITNQAVSLYARKAGWEAYKEAEDAWRKLLSNVNVSRHTK